jgi:hypothetical protein
VLRKILVVALAVILLAIPFAVRWVSLFEGRYRPEPVNRPDLSGVAAATPEIAPFVDQAKPLSPGTVLIDQAHENRFQMSELNILQARLSARGQRIEPVVATADLPDQLRYARALIVISPGTDWTPVEIEQVRRFVDKGGRLLLVTDPTRFAVVTDDLGNYMLDDDTPHLNDLAAQFDLLFQSDYLYNTVENEGNFRNIKLSQFGDSGLVEGLGQVVFYATHSIVSGEPALVLTDGETRSSDSQRSDALPVAVLAADGNVLALGDLTFMTEPYDAAYDNDRLVANIADFLGGARRQYELADFPYFFGEQVDLVYAGPPLLDGALLDSGSSFQGTFADVGKELTVRSEPGAARDTLILGLYGEAQKAEPYLAEAGVTLLITPTNGTTGEPAPSEPETVGTATVGPGLAASTEISATRENRIAIESMGEVASAGTSLLVLEASGNHRSLMVLADTQAGLDDVVWRLNAGDLEGCLMQPADPSSQTVLAICPTGEMAAGEGTGAWEEPLPEPEAPGEPPAEEPDANGVVTDTAPSPEPAGSIIVVAMDEGEGRYDDMTSLDDYVAILSDSYDVTPWSLAQDGVPEGTDLLNYDLVIWTFGDHDSQPALEEISDALITVMVSEVPFIMSGAYIGESDATAIQRDIQVSDATHPIAGGFEPGEVIDLVTPPSGAYYEVNVLSDIQEQEGTAVFVRGPNSESVGSPAIYAAAGTTTDDVRFVFIGFPVYLLPERAKTQVVLNTVDWLLNP